MKRRTSSPQITPEALAAFRRHHTQATPRDVLQALIHARPISHVKASQLLEKPVRNVRGRRLYEAPDFAGVFAVLERSDGGETVSAYVRFGEVKAERWKRANTSATGPSDG